jgi:hypothetical protein
MRHLLETAANLSAARDVLQKSLFGYLGRIAFVACGVCYTDVSRMRRDGLCADNIRVLCRLLGGRVVFLHTAYLANDGTSGSLMNNSCKAAALE